MRPPRLALLPVALAATLAGCPKELPQDASPEQLYAMGREAHDRGDWQRAIDALQRFLFQDPGNQNADSAQFLIADSYFNQDQYLTAANEFLRLAQNRPAGPLADDSRYRACLAYAELSPRPELDQEYTQEAIDECRSVSLLYPGSPFADEADSLVTELTDKLARKVYLNAEYYFKRRAYDSAIVYLEHLLGTYRGAGIEPAALAMLYDAYTRLGYTQEAEETRQRLLREYPNTPEARRLVESGSTASPAG
ncbi:MAG: outer membrane protein assembly factor BamD [Gemmatimonadetes bacterium]|uniref:Outer membrane protein assembly factor BamD n=1 Tax=Candidatus Kutchimonas denitrificans TaxID=3056748 RepID=A0AAE5C7V8_9BACT|nr:outer membrane protein assembly factor BamD [Gemmatimonadota bacterium]NIR73891.1 outer membrane protein assembly factor BamD [Candidatus Kutchimonas denitrificans]NIR99697.1 outer membrane protein assembly factor BamD [Gemmatimonadota bacterium]NIT65282.1 outer membrane protein assembly factor BamD [Gemmatimonadota bacterium]NIW73731.1 outer membrane protein assembly factor BamD [Gemmatimonadota bacterium]